MKKLSWSGLKADIFRRDRSASHNGTVRENQLELPVSTSTNPSGPASSSSCLSLNQWNSKLACINGTRSIGDFRSESTLHLRGRLSFSSFLNFKCVSSFPFSKRAECIPEVSEVKSSKSGIFYSLKRKLKGNLKLPSEYSRFKSLSKRHSYCQTPTPSVENSGRKEPVRQQICSSVTRQPSSSELCSTPGEPIQYSFPTARISAANSGITVQEDVGQLGAMAEEPTCALEETRHMESESLPTQQQSSHSSNLAWELFKLEKFGWYWGRMTRSEAEQKLADQPDGAFLVRDSSDDCHLLSLSFRCYGRTLHTRIEHSNGTFSFYAYPEADHHASVAELIEYLMNSSRSGVFCYSRSRSPVSVSYPVQLTKPVSRFSEVLSLQFICRFIIRQYVRMDHIEALPLPESLKTFVVRGTS